MSRIISRAEAWERAYEVFQQVNFNAFDYNSVKQSLIDYLKLYFPEDFNDYIESQELIAILELFAYISELFAYRLDLNAHENFITTAQRKESILRIAKLLSYQASRIIPARGLVKLTSVITTENVFDSNGVNLSNIRISWNDSNNPNWKEQFLLVMNKVLRQNFGSVSPRERVQVQDVLFELYQIDNNPLTNGVFTYFTTVSGTQLPMELVPTRLTENGPEERRPDNISSFSLLYGQDGLGDGSDTTGFFMYTKQGRLTKQTTTFDGVTPNQLFEPGVVNTNDTDIWLNNIDSDTGETVDDGTVSGAVSGEWVEVDLANAQNIIFNTNTRREKYEIETLADDRVRFVFGDGEFANIPSGSFDVWYRVSEPTELSIPQNTVVNQSNGFTYTDNVGNIQTFSFTFSLISSLQNASPSETIEHIRKVAPSVYYTQDRMVNNRDYNVFMLQDPTILKLRAMNRTFAGDSKYIYWHDPSETYENVKLFGCDAALYIEDKETFVEFTTNNLSDIIDNYIEPILSTSDFFTILTTRGVPPQKLRKRFTGTERQDLLDKLTDMINGFASPSDLNIFYHPNVGEYQFQFQVNAADATTPNPTTGDTVSLPETIWTPREGVIRVDLTPPNFWRVTWKQERIIIQSNDMRFWNTNDALKVINYDTLNTLTDRIILLKANVNSNRVCLLSDDFTFDILNQELTVDELRDIHRLNVLPQDVNGDNLPDNMELSNILNGDIEITTIGSVISLPDLMLVDDFDSGINKVVGPQSGRVYSRAAGDYTLYYNDASIGSSPVSTGEVANQIQINTPLLSGTNSPQGSPFVDTSVRLQWTDYVYFSRESTSDDWVLIDPTTTTAIINWIDEVRVGSPTEYPDNQIDGLYRRFRGRTEFNYAWFHEATRFNLIDPAQTNIIDSFIITRGYYASILDWLRGELSVEPQAPTSLDLKLSYNSLLDNKMISDTVILHPGKINLIIGDKSLTELRARLKVIRPRNSRLTDNQVKTEIVSTVETFFDINLWEFGETFYFTELAAAIHNALKSEIDSVVLVPLYANHQFGDLFQVLAREDEIIQADIGVEDIEIIESFTATNLRQDL